MFVISDPLAIPLYFCEVNELISILQCNKKFVIKLQDLEISLRSFHSSKWTQIVAMVSLINGNSYTQWN
jgi:hypothetical protein